LGYLMRTPEANNLWPLPLYYDKKRLMKYAKLMVSNFYVTESDVRIQYKIRLKRIIMFRVIPKI
jgi:hypothetical protein